MGSYTLESISKIKRRKGWYRCVFVSGGSLDVSEDILVRHSLHDGKLIPWDEYKEIRTESEGARAKEKALRLLSYRARSEKELKSRLRSTGISAKSAGTAIDDLKRLNLIDDEDFALRFTRDLIRRKPAGEFFIKTELQKKGIREAIVRKVLDQVFSEYDQTGLARKSAAQWIRRHPRSPDVEKRNKLSKYLYQRGFPWAVIEEVIGDGSAFEGS